MWPPIAAAAIGHLPTIPFDEEDRDLCTLAHRPVFHSSTYGTESLTRALPDDSGAAEFSLRIVRGGRENWVRVKTADRDSFLQKPQLQ